MKKKTFLERNMPKKEDKILFRHPKKDNELTVEMVKRTFHPSSKLIMNLKKLEIEYDKSEYT